jgi:hypothetical protein
MFTTINKATVVAGNYESNLVYAKANETGSFGNIGAGQISQFAGAAPFTGAGVTNPANSYGGRDRETDTQFVDRLKLRLQTLGRGTPLALEGGVLGIEDTTTGQRVVSANLVEDFINNEHKLYIDDGTGFSPTLVTMATSTLSGGLSGGETFITVANVTYFPSGGKILVLSASPANSEILEFSSKVVSTNRLVLSGTVANTHLSGERVLLVDVLDPAEEGQNFFRFTKYPIQALTYEVYDNSSGVYALRVAGSDYFLNRTNGEVQFSGSGLPSGALVVGNYTYYTGLIALVQKVLNGDKKDSISYPGLVAGGVIVHVDTPIIRQVPVTFSVSTLPGYDETEIRNSVKLAVEVYIDSLGIGENVILAKIIEKIMNVDGVANTYVITPTSDVIVLENELPRSFDSNGNSLVSVF